MIFSSFIELDALFSIILIIIYGLLSLRSKQILLSDTYLFVRLVPLLWVIYQNGFDIVAALGGTADSLTVHTADSTFGSILGLQGGIEILLALCVIFIMPSFSTANSFEASILVLLAFIFQYYMLHSTDLIAFFITLEAQNFCFFVLCGMLPFTYSNKHNISMSIEVGLKYLLLSAFSSGVLLYGTSILYLQTGSVQLASLGSLGTSLARFQGDLGTFTHNLMTTFEGDVQGAFAVYLILCSILFKLGVAPFHLWMYQIYSGTHRGLILYITTIPKLCIIAFWIMHLQGIISNYTLILFSLLSGFIGSTAFTQPNIRYLLVYSSISEIGLLVAALETAGYHALLQHLSIYIVSQYLLWNIHSTGGQVKRIMPILAVSLAGLPPLAGFIGKAWVFWHLATTNATTLLVLSLLFAFVSVIFYLRLIRVSWNTAGQGSNFARVISNPIERTAHQALEGGLLFSAKASRAAKATPRVVASEQSEGTILNAIAQNLLNGPYQEGRFPWNLASEVPRGPSAASTLRIYAPYSRYTDSRVFLTSTCVVLLVILPIFLMKPFF